MVVDLKDTLAVVTVRRCHDAEIIAEVLARDYFDAPICYFPKGLIKAAAKDFMATSPNAYFLLAEANDRYAGFVFGHTAGPKLWRRFAATQMFSHGPSLARVVFAQFIAKPIRSFLNRRHRRPGASRSRIGPKELPSDVGQIQRPFAWSPHTRNRGQIDLLFVNGNFRGQGIARRLLTAMTTEMSAAGVSLVEAHVDPENIASLRAFLCADWQAYQMLGADFYLRYEMART